MVFHAQLQRFPHSARAFNLSETEVRATIAEPWEAGRLVELGERFWTPGECKLTILAGPPLDPGELGMGRGWAAALRSARDVTGELIGGPGVADPVRAAPGAPFADFKDEVLALVVAGPQPLPDLWRLAGRRYPDRALSDCLALAERAVAELLHDELAELTIDGPVAGVATAEIPRVLRAWETWLPGATARVCLRGSERGGRALKNR
ncbi:MAG TPA: hypothetical protein VFR49_07255 [Solirubrobacteraceae bacterium]|nr:hypothetical protein [Solirubrobacteraceae bacterium]